MKKLFGTDGIRGLANEPPMDPQTIFKAAAGAADVLMKRYKKVRGLKKAIVMGRDTRASGTMLESAAAAGFASRGMDVLLASVIPTPGVSYLVKQGKLMGGAVISASHNPFGDNGIKLFGPGGVKLEDKLEGQIEQAMASLEAAGPTGKDVGLIKAFPQGAELYRKQVKKSIGRTSLSGMKIVVDCANGAAGEFTPKVLSELGAKVITIHDKPNGVNINRNCGSLHLNVAKYRVRKEGADLGISHDGDADRALFVDERGGLVDGDHILAFCARHLWRKGVPSGKVVSTVMANLGLELALQEQGLTLVRTDVGDRWVKEAMDREGAVLGGEQSGHIIFSEYAPTGDGLLTALKVLQVVARTGKPLSEVSSIVTKYPQTLVNVIVKEKVPFPSLPAVQKALREQQERLDGNGRVLLRYSGTEPLARVMVEGKDNRLIREAADKIATAIESAIGTKARRAS